MGRVGVSDEMQGVTSGTVLAFSGVEVQHPIIMLREFWRVSWRFRETLSLTSSA